MKVAGRIIIGLLVMVVGVPTVWITKSWFDASVAISASERSGYLDRATSDMPLSRTEQIFAAVVFGRALGRRAAPCNTLASIWSVSSRGYAPSQLLALHLPTRPSRRDVQGDVDRLLIQCQLEQRYSDRQLLRLMLSHVYFGHGQFGLTAVSSAEFNVPSDRLSEEQAERLAVLLRNPTWRDNPAEWSARAAALAARLNSSRP